MQTVAFNDGGVKDTVPFNHIETSYRKDLK